MTTKSMLTWGGGDSAIWAIYTYAHVPSTYICSLIILGWGMRVVGNGNNLKEGVVRLRFTISSSM